MPWDIPYLPNKQLKDNMKWVKGKKKPNKKPIKNSYSGKRASPSARGYDNRWRKLRLWWLRRNPLCLYCRKAASQVDHIIPFQSAGSLEERERLRLSMDNLRSLCISCHAKVTREYHSKKGGG